MNYKVIEVFTSEDVRWHGKPLAEAIVDHVRSRKLAARCLVLRGLAGCYESGEVATAKVEILSFKMPLKIEIVLPASEADSLLPALQDMVTDGVVTVREVAAASHRTEKHLLPRHLRVRDVMTASPKTVLPTTTAGDVVRLLLSANFNSVPVVDDGGRPVGIVTQSDLITRAGMPVRLGLLSAMGPENLDAVLQALAAKKVAEIMSRPVVTAAEDQPLAAAVDLMLARNLKRLPVVNAAGRLAGILARLDVFRTITTETPDWRKIEARQIVVADARTVRDIMRRDTHTVVSTATLEDVMRVIDTSDLQRVAVVDEAGRLAGMISDRDLLRLFSGHKVGLWDRLAGKLTFTEMGRRHKAVVELARKQTAGEIMKTDLVTVAEDTPVEEAIRLMTEWKIKRLPVVGPGGEFKGMVSRDSLLRAGTGGK
jgi:CBS domain-containing protein